MSDKLSTLRHDLRGPLQTILNAAYLIETNPAQTASRLEIIRSAVKQATEMLKDPLDIIKVEKIQFDRFIEEVLKSIAMPENIELTVYPESQEFYFDSVKMKRVLDNLVRNAIEAMTPNGGKLVIKSMQRDYNIITVTDTGPGIPESIIRSIFIAQQTTKEGPGHGQGLISCRQIVIAHGGTIAANNNTDSRGATFTISLPPQPCDPS